MLSARGQDIDQTLIYSQLNPWEPTPVKIQSKFKNCQSRWYVWKCRLQVSVILFRPENANNAWPSIISWPHWSPDKVAAIFQTTFSNAFLNENVWISIKVSLNFGPINSIPALVQIMAWRRIGDKSLSEAITPLLADAYMRHPASISKPIRYPNTRVHQQPQHGPWGISVPMSSRRQDVNFQPHLSVKI